MYNADDFCRFAQFGQTMKIQKCLQSHSVDVNALNLYGESALSTATYYNQVLCVEYLLANKADPKLRLSAGHTAIHMACRLGNVPILHMLLSIKKHDNNTEEDQKREDKHIFECLKLKDNSYLTPIHWAAAQESVSKRQKMFAYLDKRMPGVLDSRYNLHWFDSWANIHPWVIETNHVTPSFGILSNSNQTYQQDQSSEITSLDMTPKLQINNYERTPRAPLGSAINNKKLTKLREPRVQIEEPNEPSTLPKTPVTSCKVTVTSIYNISKHENQQQQLSSSSTNQSTKVNGKSLGSFDENFIHRAHRVQIQPKIDFPPPPPITSLDADETFQPHDYEDVNTPLSSKRPSHNLLSNIIPSPSIDQSSQQSVKQIGSSFGFDATINSNNDTYAKDDDQSELETVSSYGSNQIDYLCQSTSTLGMTSSNTRIYYS